MHGPPVHIGDPAVIGIKDLSQPDLTPPSLCYARQPIEGEVAMFWPCSATNRLLAKEAKLPLMIVSYPARMFMTNKVSVELATL